MKLLLGITICILTSVQLFAQTPIWEEDFESYTLFSGLIGIDAVAAGDYPINTPFTIDASALNLADSENDYVQVRFTDTEMTNKSLEARDLEGAVTVLFDPIDISAQSGDLTIAVEDIAFTMLSTTSTWNPEAYINISYSLNNGENFRLISNHNGEGDVDHTFLAGTLAEGESRMTQLSETFNPGNATTIIIRIEAENDGANEEFGIDNINILRNSEAINTEDFESYAEGTGITGTGSHLSQGNEEYPAGVTAWSLSLADEGQLINTEDFLYVSDVSSNGTQILKWNDVNDAATFETAPISIAGNTSLSMSADITFDETEYEEGDYLDVFYSLDNGITFTLAADDGSGHTYGGLNITANFNTADTKNVFFRKNLEPAGATTVIVRITANSNSGAEDYELDNVRVYDEVLSVRNLATPTFTLYPNPITGSSLFVASLETTPNQVVIYDTAGRKVLETIATDGVIDVSSLVQGLYLVEITQGNRTAVQKIIKL